jgi:hypothetical protein
MANSRYSVPSSAPGSSPKRPAPAFAPGSSSKSHYDPSTGSWDGQVPHPDLVHGELSPAGILEKPSESWPDVFKRDAWVDSVAGLYEVTQYEVVVLRRIMFRCGSGSQACWESQLSMAKYLKVGRRTIQRALASLLEMGMIHKVTFYRGDNSHNAYIPTFECPPDHLRLTGANGPDLVNLPKTLDLPVHLRLTGAYMRPPGAQTVRTVTVTDHKSCDGLLSQKEDELGPENVLPQPFISAPQAQMEDVASAADVPECESCALPWTSDVGRHRTALRRGMRKFICDACREAQIAQKVGLATPA